MIVAKISNSTFVHTNKKDIYKKKHAIDYSNKINQTFLSNAILFEEGDISHIGHQYADFPKSPELLLLKKPQKETCSLDHFPLKTTVGLMSCSWVNIKLVTPEKAPSMMIFTLLRDFSFLWFRKWTQMSSAF